jgi:hypothetical protein
MSFQIRKEADKVAVPKWPAAIAISDWRTALVGNLVTAAAGDIPEETVISWISQIFGIRYINLRTSPTILVNLSV